MFWSNSNTPYFAYKSTLRRDFIHHPGLFFVPAWDINDDENRIIYETTLPPLNFTVDVLEILYNFLFESEYYHPTGFWLIKQSRERICGWGVDNLRSTLELRKPKSLIFLIGYQNFLILATYNSNTNDNKIYFKIYLTRSIEPYIDTLDFLKEKLTPFLKFYEIGFSNGHEIRLTCNKFFDKYDRPHFTANVLGGIIHRNRHSLDDNFTYIFALDLPKEAGILQKVSPCFITCPGGCLDVSFKALHTIHLFQVLSLPEIDIGTLMITKIY